MVKKKRVNQEKSLTGLFTAVSLILFASFFSSQVHETQIPRIEGLGITGFAASSIFSSTCNSANTAFKTTGNSNALAALYTSTDSNFGTSVCITSDSGHTCKSDGSNIILKLGSDGTAALPDATQTSWRCDDLIKNGQETDVDCGGPSCNACDVAKSCSVNLDCKNNNCVSGICKTCPIDPIPLKIGSSCPSGYSQEVYSKAYIYIANKPNPTHLITKPS